MASLPETFTFAGAIDPHIHVREPSPTNHAETFALATAAAALAGNVGLVDISNTPNLPTRDLRTVEQKEKIIRSDAVVPVGISVGIQPEYKNLDELTMLRRRVIAGKLFAHPSTGNDEHYDAADVAEEVTRFAKDLPNIPLFLHGGRDNLAGYVELAEKTGLHLHLFHANNPRDIDLISKAKSRGVRVSAGICLHHLLFTNEDSARVGWGLRMQPELPTEDERQGLWEQVTRGQVQVFETDHAPHMQAEKELADKENPEGRPEPGLKKVYGIRSLRQALPMFMYELLQRMDTEEALATFENMTSKGPQRLLGVSLPVGTRVTYKMEEYEMQDDGPAPAGVAPSPLLGRRAIGKVVDTYISGEPIIRNGRLVGKHPRVLRRGTVI